MFFWGKNAELNELLQISGVTSARRSALKSKFQHLLASGRPIPLPFGALAFSTVKWDDTSLAELVSELDEVMGAEQSSQR